MYSLGFPGSSAGKESICNVGDLGLITELGRSPEERNGYPLQYSSLETPGRLWTMDSQRVGPNRETFSFTFTS